MQRAFSEQLADFDRVLQNGRIALCVGSGISRERVPLLAGLIDRAIQAINGSVDREAAFQRFATRFGLNDVLAAQNPVPTVANPVTLLEFKGLAQCYRHSCCKVMATRYAECFQQLSQMLDGKQNLLEAIGIAEFCNLEPDVEHWYIALLCLEDQVQEILTTNWDRLIERAIEELDSTRAPFRVIKTEVDMVDVNKLPRPHLGKIHGCATQFPTAIDHIILTAQDLITAANSDWRKALIRHVMDRNALCSGYSHSDFTLQIPVDYIQDLRRHHELHAHHYYVAQEGTLEPYAEILTDNQPNQQISLYGKDAFTSMYFWYLRDYLARGVRSLETMAQPSRPFPSWPDTEWQKARVRVEHLLEHRFPSLLDRLFGDAAHRIFDKAKEVPIQLSMLRQLFLGGNINEEVKYIPFGPSAKDDLILCILLAALADVAGKSNITLLEKSCKLGFCIEFETGARVRIILLRGTYPDRAPAELHAHIWIHMEDAARDIPVIIVIPCAPGMPEISDTELPQQYLNRSALPGQAKPEISFIPADYLFNSVSYEQLLSVLTKFVVASEVSDDVQ